MHETHFTSIALETLFSGRKKTVEASPTGKLRFPAMFPAGTACDLQLSIASDEGTTSVPRLDLATALPGTPRSIRMRLEAPLKLFLKCLFGFIFLFMVVMTVRTSLQVPIWQASFTGNVWAWATLYDAYFGFITFFCWVAWREKALGSKVLWFVLIMALGNIAMSLYVLLQLFALKPDEPVGALFQKKAA